MKVKNIMSANNMPLYAAGAFIPPAAAIITDPRGTNARVRGNRRYGKYFAPQKDFAYYKIYEYDEMLAKYGKSQTPIGLEDMVETIGFPKPVDSQGRWLKNPINPDTAKPSDFVELGQSDTPQKEVVNVNDNELNEWLET